MKIKKILTSMFFTMLLFSYTNNVKLNTYANNLNVYDNFEYNDISNITSTDKIVGNYVIVVIKHQYSIPNKIWTAEDFGVENIASIEDMTAFVDLKGEELENYISSITFNQRLCINLSEKGTDKVLKMIDDLQSCNNPVIKNVFYDTYLDITYEETTSNYTENIMPNTHINATQFNNMNIFSMWNYTKGNNNIIAGIIEDNIHPTEYIPNLLPPYDATEYPEEIISTNPILPYHPHTIKVAGILNGQNIGVAPNTYIKSLCVAKDKYAFTLKHFYNAIQYAIDKKIAVLNCSFSFSMFTDTSNNLQLSEDIQKLLTEEYNGLFVCSAGNQFSNNDNINKYPSNLTNNIESNCSVDNILSIANCTNNGNLNLSSNYGKNTVDLCAIGKVYTTKFMNSTPNDFGEYNIGIDIADGTSFSSPIVAGTISLLFSYNPDLYYNIIDSSTSTERIQSILRVKNAIINSTTKIPTLENKTLSGGMLNAYGAMKEVSREVTLNVNELGKTTDLKINVVASNGNTDYDSIYTLDYDELDTNENGDTVFYIPDLNEDTAKYTITLMDGNNTEDTSDDVIIHTIDDITNPQLIRNKYSINEEKYAYEMNIMPVSNSEDVTITFDSYLDGDVTLNNEVTSEDGLAVLMYVVNKYNIIQTGATSLFDIGHGNITVNGDISSNNTINVHASSGNFNGKITARLIQTWGNVNAQTETTMEELISESPFTDNQMTSLFFENTPYIDNEYNNDTYAAVNNGERNNININNPLYADTINLQNNVNISNNMKANGNIDISGSVQNDTRCVIYSANGDINLDSTNFSFSGLIYAPNGTVTITGKNINITGTIIAKEVIIDGETVNFNTNNNFLNYTNLNDKYLDLTNTYFSDLQLFIADMDEDNKVTASDANCILNKVVNKNN